MKKIGLLGLTFSNPNKGCMALAYSFLNILKELKKEDLQIVVFSDTSYSFDDLQSDINIEMYNYKLKKINEYCNLIKKIEECDVFFDFTEGDSFSDIYGLKRMIKVSLLKKLVLLRKKKLILCPQTYGPYKKSLSKIIAKDILKNAEFICTRDELSTENIQKLTNRNVPTYTDVAFSLPINPDIHINSDKIKVGINVSALLWNGGYNGNNQFDLKTDYKEYCLKLIEKLLSQNKYEIYLIPHVYSENMPDVENDFVACNLVKEKYPECRVAPTYNSPCDIKAYISNMDIFIGARMHATIASFSSQIVTIPFSYSRKFEGLYNSLNFDYIIKAREFDTEESLNKTFEYIEKGKEIIDIERSAMKEINNKLTNFKNSIKKYIV